MSQLRSTARHRLASSWTPKQCHDACWASLYFQLIVQEVNQHWASSGERTNWKTARQRQPLLLQLAWCSGFLPLFETTDWLTGWPSRFWYKGNGAGHEKSTLLPPFLSIFFFSFILNHNSCCLIRGQLVAGSTFDWRDRAKREITRWRASGIYPPITYYWTAPLILDHSYLVGKLTSSKIADT